MTSDHGLQPGGRILHGKYRVEQFLGAGAFAQVYRVHHLELNHDRAVKVVSPGTPGVGSTLVGHYRDRFRQEAELGAQLHHPHVVHVYDFEEEGGRLYLVMEYAPGGSLAQWIARGPLPVHEAVRVTLDVASGLEALFGRFQAVHRDVKPSNVLFGADGSAQVSDLGLAQVPGGPSHRVTLGDGAPGHPGTPEYASPEQELTAAYLSPSSDVYSLGCVLFEMLTGRVWKAVRVDVERVRELQQEVPEWLDEVLARMLAERPGLTRADAPDQSKRYVHMGAVRKALEAGQAKERLRLEVEEKARAPADRRTPSGLLIAAAENVAELLARPDPPSRIWWEKAEMELCLVPAGEFLMGSAETDGEADPDEKCPHVVLLDAYYVGRYPVTQAQYARFVQETGHRVPHRPEDWATPYNWDEGGRTPPAGTQQHPVVLVSWHDAAAYCHWAGLRLPTEAEWEKAARSTDARIYPWGNTWDPDRCNSAENGRRRTDVVSAHSPGGDSPYHCAAMAGNVWEWCADWYDEAYYAHSPFSNPQGPDPRRWRVRRGGCWESDSKHVRSAFRGGRLPDLRTAGAGFRCVASARP